MSGEACHLSYVDSEALVTHTWLDLVQQGKRVLRCHSSHVLVRHCHHLLSQSSELMEVCCKQTECLHLLSKVPANTFMSVGSSVWHLPQNIQFLVLTLQ